MKSMWALATSSFRECLRVCDCSLTLSSGAVVTSVDSWGHLPFLSIFSFECETVIVLNHHSVLECGRAAAAASSCLMPCCLTETSPLLPAHLSSSTRFLLLGCGFLSLCSPLPDIYWSTGSVRQTLLVRTPLGSLTEPRSLSDTSCRKYGPAALGSPRNFVWIQTKAKRRIPFLNEKELLCPCF